MADLIRGNDISEAWVNSMEYLISSGGLSSNLIIVITQPGNENVNVRNTLDEFICAHQGSRIRRIRKVADTIFPIDYYSGPAGDEARCHLYRMQNLASKIERRYIKRGTYFDRLINWPGASGSADQTLSNQLERRIVILRRRWQRGIRNSNIAELSISTAVPDIHDFEAGGPESVSGELRVQDSTLDNFVIGFPCLSHISLTLFSGRIDLTAVYRNQHFVTKAYGNFVGLSDLQNFICREVGCEVGDLVCVATHADAELGQNGIRKQTIVDLVSKCRASLDLVAT